MSFVAVVFHENWLEVFLEISTPIFLHIVLFSNKNIIDVVISLGEELFIIIPYSLLETSSSAPPTLVMIGVVLHAAASKSQVEKPSYRVGRQNASDVNSIAATSSGDSFPSKWTFLRFFFFISGFKGPSPAKKK